jgi:hypothetical protein
MSAAPIEHLELQASLQRERIQQTALELKSKVDETKRQYSAANILHRNFGRVSAAASLLGLVLGYKFAGEFTHR